MGSRGKLLSRYRTRSIIIILGLLLFKITLFKRRKMERNKNINKENLQNEEKDPLWFDLSLLTTDFTLIVNKP